MCVGLFIATTLDGYIATTDDELQWLFDVQGEGDNGYGHFYEGVNSIIMGRRTYEWLKREQPEQWAYKGKQTYVVSQHTFENTAEISFIKLTELHALLSSFKATDQKIWVVGGGQLIKYFLEQDWVDELQVTVAPVLLGKGIPLFPEGSYSQHLKLVETTTYGQFVELHYLVEKTSTTD